MEKGQMMIRSDGEYTIYILQHKYVKPEDGTEWWNSGDGEQFCGGNGDYRAYPRRAFNANGMCWQETGIHGCFDFEMAQRMLTLVATSTPGRKFRICKVEISQKTTELASLQWELH
jgi:hypothetical protein